jgi:hypothetical protein
MAFALVYAAEHYVVDILLGWIYAVIAFYAVSRLANPLRGVPTLPQDNVWQGERGQCPFCLPGGRRSTIESRRSGRQVARTSPPRVRTKACTIARRFGSKPQGTARSRRATLVQNVYRARAGSAGDTLSLHAEARGESPSCYGLRLSRRREGAREL